jgi:hypothetical protein
MGWGNNSPQVMGRVAHPPQESRMPGTLCLPNRAPMPSSTPAIGEQVWGLGFGVKGLGIEWKALNLKGRIWP